LIKKLASEAAKALASQLLTMDTGSTPSKGLDADSDQLFDAFNQAAREDEDDLNPAHYSDAVTWATDWTTETLILQLERHTIDLDPDFQRRDAWTLQRKSRFVESLILGLPIPQIVLAERKEKKGSFIVLDGKQRLLTLQQFCSGKPDGTPGFSLQSLTVLKRLNGSSYEDLQRRTDLADILTAFNGQTVRTVVIKNWPNDDFLYTVFLRLNSNSVPLSPQELRKALHPGPFLTFVDRKSSASTILMSTLGLREPDFRMRDVEIVVRYYAFKHFIKEYHGNLKSFLDNTCNTLNLAWTTKQQEIEEEFAQLEQALVLTKRIFGRDAFRKYTEEGYETRLNRAVFDIFLFYFSNPKYAEKAQAKGSAIKRAYEQLCLHDAEFRRSLETSTKITEVVKKRFNTWGKKLSSILRVRYQPAM
jgi:Protein of unknown function DUF262